MKLLCKLFGHCWSERRYMYGPFVDGIKTKPYKRCLRCNEFAWDFNRSDLDESCGSHEKWLDKHMD
ncbi:DUF1660 family phage protein [Lactococcus lactis]|uniref:DUF1660 family phage protein n=1 Tax=Lactococcus lactis TaxID=1358 RepID=UPI0028913761|nr:DUF1660 family phage protein [Lactococcus lactis]MDT2903338.1 DUF1660 family phage protein [Lactococcus lactis]